MYQSYYLPIVSGKLRKLTDAMSQVVDDFMIVSFVMLDSTDEDSIEEVLIRTDHSVQYGEDQEVKETDYDGEEEPGVSSFEETENIDAFGDDCGYGGDGF
jgi:hypothetical protein